MMTRRISRRRFIAQTGAGAAAAATANIAAPFVHTAHAAGSLNVGMWDHWVPGANAATEKLIKDWAEKEKVDVKVDFITSQGQKLNLTAVAEGQAKSGHDVLFMGSWMVSRQAELLEPVDDVVNDLVKENGDVSDVAKYMARFKGVWKAVPSTFGSQMKGPASRIDLLKKHAGIDVQALYPAGAPPKSDSWTYDAFLKAAEACHKAGVPFGIGLGTTADSVDSIGAIFSAFGAILIDENEKITIKSDSVRQALDYCKRLYAFLPPDAPSWDDASNNKAFVAGQASLILNPPSAWAVALRDAPNIAEQTWHHPMPKGPKGRYASFLQQNLAIWSFSKNKSAGKSLLRHISSRASAEAMVSASKGYDIPPFAKFKTFGTWADIGPPKGTLYHYPDPHQDQILAVAAMPSPHAVAAQIYAQGTMSKMVVRHAQGEAMEKTLAWAESEVEGFMR
ncbi:MAG: extracellular solute-binding protein [Hyphomicrobiaceae bacterium]|nr:extracellular solute-binding protein [Hyphomicrobiaceae bacterium]